MSVSPLIVDTHVHISTDDIVRYPRIEKPPFEAPDYYNPVEMFLRKMDEAGVTHATIVQPFALYGSDNSYHADSAEVWLGRLRSVCGLSPSSEAPRAARHWLLERGMGGMRINTRGEADGLLHPAIPEMLSIAARVSVPVTILMSPRHMEMAGKLARRYPTILFVLDHLGGAREDKEGSFGLLAQLAPLPNVALKFSSGQVVAKNGAQRIAELITLFGPRRLMWGSNYPVTDLGGYAQTVLAAMDALSDLSAEDRHAVFGGSAFDIWFRSAATEGRAETAIRETE
jgi:Predicted metal-dependent hydrolase of the TIM-barrel fold